MSILWKRFSDQISHYQSFVLVSHVRPDCDAIGSELGMAAILRKLGKDVRIINAHRVPPSLEFLDPAGTIEVLGDHVQADEISCDCFMILDTSAWVQLGDMADVIRSAKCDKMVLDHHVGEEELGATMYKDYQPKRQERWLSRPRMPWALTSIERWRPLCSPQSRLIPVGSVSAVSRQIPIA